MSSPALRALPPHMWSDACGTRVCLCVCARMCTRVRKTQLCRLMRGARGQVWLPHANYKVWTALGHRSDEEMAAESTRRFTKNLLKPGSAAEIRQTACNAVRHSAVTVSRPVWIVEKRKKNMVVVEKRITTCGALRLLLFCAFKRRYPQKKALHLEMWKFYPSSVHTATHSTALQLCQTWHWHSCCIFLCSGWARCRSALQPVLILHRRGVGGGGQFVAFELLQLNMSVNMPHLFSSTEKNPFIGW